MASLMEQLNKSSGIAIDPQLEACHFRLYPEMDRSRVLVASLAKELLPMVRRHEAAARLLTGDGSLLTRLGLTERWIGVDVWPTPDAPAMLRPMISTYGNGSLRLTDFSKLSPELTLRTVRGQKAVNLERYYARRAMSTLAEAALVATGLREEYGLTTATEEQLRPEFAAWLSHDPTSNKLFDESKPLWMQPFVTLPKPPEAPAS